MEEIEISNSDDLVGTDGRGKNGTARAGRMYVQASALYAAMNKVANSKKIAEIPSVTEFGVEHVRMSRGSVGQIIKRLQVMGCIEYKKGAINRPAVIRLIEAPTEERWIASPAALTREVSYDSLIKGYRDLQRQIGSLDVVRMFQTVADEIETMKKRITELEKSSKKT